MDKDKVKFTIGEKPPEELFSVTPEGKIFIRGVLVAEDKEVVDALLRSVNK